MNTATVRGGSLNASAGRLTALHVGRWLFGNASGGFGGGEAHRFLLRLALDIGWLAVVVGAGYRRGPGCRGDQRSAEATQKQCRDKEDAQAGLGT